eukprot:6492562-Amphidinium_carterae.2
MAEGSGVMSTPGAKNTKLQASSTGAKTLRQPRLVEECDSIDGVIRKCLYDNFLRRGWTQESVTSILVDGLCIHDRLKRDKRMWLASGEPVMGKTYFRTVKKMYMGNPDDGTQALVVDKSQPLNSRLHSAVIKMKKNAPDRAPFANYLDSCESLNRREFIGVARCCADMEPSAGAAQRRACLAMLKAIVRLGLMSKFPDVVEAVREKLEETMVQHVVQFYFGLEVVLGNQVNKGRVHIQALKVGTQAWEFLEMHAAVWPLVMPKEKVLLIQNLGADRPWSDVKSALVEVCGVSELGRRMFGDKLGELVKEDLHLLVKTAVAEIFKQEVVDESSLAKIKKEAEEKILELPDSDLLPASFEVEVCYRTRGVSLTCRSVSEYVDLACQAALKTGAVQTGALASLPGEEAAAVSVTLQTGWHVAAALLAPLAKTRDWAVKTMKLASASSSKNALDREGKNRN